MTNVTCGLTAKKPELDPCPTLVIEYGTTFDILVYVSYALVSCRTVRNMMYSFIVSYYSFIFIMFCRLSVSPSVCCCFQNPLVTTDGKVEIA